MFNIINTEAIMNYTVPVSAFDDIAIVTGLVTLVLGAVYGFWVSWREGRWTVRDHVLTALVCGGFWGFVGFVFAYFVLLIA